MASFINNLLDKMPGVAKPQKKFLDPVCDDFVDARQSQLSEFESLQ